MIQCGFLISFKKTYEYLLVRPYIQIKEYFWQTKIAYILRLHVSDYKISGTTSAGPVVDQTCILKQ